MPEENAVSVNSATNGAKKNRFVVFYKDHILSVKLENIAYFQIVDGYMFLITTDGKKYPLRKSMRDLEEVLDPCNFFKVNRSEVISFDSIEKIESFFGQRVVVSLKPFGKVIVSKSRLTRFLSWLDM
jgi:DNA-binding LytR/AlgR family response regulator